MCNVGNIIGLVGAGVEAFGSTYKGQAEADQYLARSRIYGLNADIAESNANILRAEAEMTERGAALAEARALLDESRMRRGGKELTAAQRVEIVSRNLDPAAGSALTLAGRTAAEIQADIDIRRATGMMEYADTVSKSASIMGAAAGEIGRASSARISAASSISAASASKTAGKIGAATALLKGAGKLFETTPLLKLLPGM